MDEKNILHLLSSIQVGIAKKGYTGSEKTTRWLNISCPFAPYTHASKTDKNPSFGITIKDGSPSSYKCFGCNKKGRLSALPSILGGYRKKDYSAQRLWAEIAETKNAASIPLPDWENSGLTINYSNRHVDPDQTTPDSVSDAGYGPAVGLRYLRQRGLSFLDVLRLDLRYDNHSKRVLFPVYDAYDKFAGFTGRSIQAERYLHKGNPKVKDYYGLKKREVFLRLRGKQQGKKIISEGLFDYARAVSYGYLNAHAILGTAITEEKLDILIQEADPVYLFLDNDLAGWQAMFGVPDKDGKLDTQQAWAFRLYKEIPVWIVPYARSLTGEDPGGIKTKAIYDAHIKRAWFFTGKAPVDLLGDPLNTGKT